MCPEPIADRQYNGQVVRRFCIRTVLAIVFAIASTFPIFSQCPVAQFISPSNVCLNEQFEFVNNSLDASSFEWNFCSTNFDSSPLTSKLVSSFGAVYYSKFLQVGDDDYIFFISSTQSKLVGLRIRDLETFDYEIHCEIDLSSFILNPTGFDIIYDNGTWTGLITSIVSPFKLVRIVLDDQLVSLVRFEDLSSVAALATPFDVKILKSEDQYFVFLTSNTAPVSQQLIRLSFGASLLNLPLTDYIAFPSSSQSASISFYNSCNAWSAFVSSRNGKIFRVDFATGLDANPAVTELTLSVPLSDPAGLAIVNDHDEFILLIQSRNGFLYSGRISFIEDNSVDVINLGNIKTSSRDWGVTVLPFDGSYKVVTSNFTSGGMGGLYAVNFTTSCVANVKTSINSSPKITFQQPGTFKVTLKALNMAGDFGAFTREVFVSSSLAPELQILHPIVSCVDAEVEFGLTSDFDNQLWEFGDGGESSELVPKYFYSVEGTYAVKVTVTASNGCSNSATSSLRIFDKPTPSFTLPTALLCTNNEFLFPTTTPDTYDGYLAYQWFVDDDPVSNERDLKYTFTNTGPKQIKLKTSIPGCSDEITKTTSTVQAGPAVDFSITGTCEDESFSFKNNISDPVQSYHWDFGSGQTSDDPDAVHTFSDYGEYPVSLTATNAIGCQTIENKTITVHSRPLAEFAFQGTPAACSNAIAFFENHTNNPDHRPITQWHWQYNDDHDPANTSNVNGQHLFAQPGTYSVSLTATTSAGCTATLEKPITIHPSPSATFTFNPACEDVPVLFNGPDDPDIKTSYWELGTSYYYDASPIHTFAAPGDYRVYAEFHGSNGCISTVEKTIQVPIPLTPDFAVLKNCVDHEAVFTNTTQGNDLVTDTQWTFTTAASASGSPATRTFTQQGTETVTLHVTAESGCAYEATKMIEILPAPLAQFSATPETGAYPLEVLFANTSSHANRFLWEFMDGSDNTSAMESPMHTFSELGSFDVKLTVYNSQECQDTSVKTVFTVAPLPDAYVEKITRVENADGTTKLVVTIHNKGNTILKDLPLIFDFSGNLSLQEVMPDPIAPGERYNFVLSPSIQNMQLSHYLCVSLSVLNDLTPEDNRSCSGLDTQLFVFPAYPNPANANLQLEWISNEAGNVVVSLIDQLGRRVFKDTASATPGLNTRFLDLEDVGPGVYLLLIESVSSKTGQRIVVID